MTEVNTKRKLSDLIAIWFLRILSSFILIIVLIMVLLGYFSEPMLRNYLTNMVSEQSGKTYKIEFEELDLSLLTGELEVKNISLLPDTSLLYVKDQAHPRTITVKIEHIRAGGIRWIKALFSGRLNLGEIDIINPVIELRNYKKSLTPREKKNTFYSILGGNLKAVSIKDFKIKGGFFAAYKDQDSSSGIQIQAENIEVDVEDFLMDSTINEQKHKVLYAGSVEVSADRYRMMLKNRSYELSTSRFLLSSDESKIALEDIRLIPVVNEENEFEAANIFEINVPSVNLAGVDVMKFHSDDNLFVQAFHLHKPKIKIIHRSHHAKDKSDPFQISDLYSVISEYISDLDIKELKIHEATLEFANYKENDESLQKISLPRTYIGVKNFRLNEKTQYDRKKFLFSDNIDLTILDYTIPMPDSSHMLKADRFHFASDAGLIQIDSLRVFPLSNNQKEGTRMNLRLPYLSLKGFDIGRLYYDKFLRIDQAEIKNPWLSLNLFPKHEKSNRRTGQFPSIPGVLHGVIVKSLSLQQGNMQVNGWKNSPDKPIIARTIGLNVSDFRLDSTLKEFSGKWFYASAMNLSADLANNTILLPDSIHQLNPGFVEISTSRSRIVLNNVILEPVNPEGKRNKTNVRFAFPSLVVNGIDLHKAYFNQSLKVASIQVNSPEIDIYPALTKRNKSFALSDLLKGLFNDVSINELGLNNLKIKVREGSATKIPDLDIADADLRLNDLHVNFLRPRDSSQTLYPKRSLISIHDCKVVLPDKSHTLKIADINYSSENGNIRLSEISLRPENNKSEKGTFDIVVPAVNLTGVDLSEVIYDKELFANSLRIAQPKILLRNYQKEKPKGKLPPVDFDLFPIISGFLEKLSIDTFNLDQGSLWLSASGTGRDAISVASFDLDLKELKVDSAKGKRSDDYFFAKSISTVLRDCSMFTNDSLYVIKAERIRLSSADSILSFQALRMIPLYEKYMFARVKGIEIDRIEMFTPGIRLNSLDVPSMIIRKQFKASSLDVNDIKVDMFRDKRMPFQSDGRSLPQQALRNMGALLKIDSVRVNGAVTYEEQADDLGSGKISFDKLDVSMLNLCNDSIYMQNREMTIDARSYVMNEAFLVAHVRMPLNAPNDSFFYCGTMDKVDLKTFNKMLEPVGFVHIDHGVSESMAFSVRASSIASQGTMCFFYRNLNIEMVDKQSGNTDDVDQELLAFLANRLVVKRHNKDNRKFKQGEIHYLRNDKKSVFNYCWKTILSGIKSSVGIPEILNKRKATPKNNA